MASLNATSYFRVSTRRGPVAVPVVKVSRRCLASAVAMAAAAAVGLPGLSARCLARIAPGSGAPWPDLRLWIRQKPDGTAEVSRHRGHGATVAFDAYSRRHEGTKEVLLGGERFYAFQAPRLGAEHLVVWRRLQCVREAADALPKDGIVPFRIDPHAPLRVSPSREHKQLTAAVWCWDNLQMRDPNRYLDNGDGDQWMYWESFWAPAEPAAYAAETPAFGDAQGKMLAPILGLEEEEEQADAVGALPRNAGVNAEVVRTRKLKADSEEPVASTATATAMKDRAYAVVYQFNVWGSDVSRSGTGSDYWSPEARLAVTALEAVIDRYKIRSVLDCACGDATWVVPFFVARHPEIAYCGCDIVPEVVQQNRQRFPGLQFLAIDLAESPLPAGADLVFSKETLNHMGIEDAEQALRRFAATGAKYLLTNVHEDADNAEGYQKTCYTTYIKYDYELPPFNLKKIDTVIEYQGLETSFTIFALPAP